MSDNQLLFVPDLAKRLGVTEGSVRGHLQRGTDAIPKSFRYGRKHAWRKKDVDAFIADKATGVGTESRGRPRNSTQVSS